MFYLSQPIAGLLLITSQLFSGRVINFTSCGSGWRITEYQHSRKPWPL